MVASGASDDNVAVISPLAWVEKECVFAPFGVKVPLKFSVNVTGGVGVVGPSGSSLQPLRTSADMTSGSVRSINFMI
jgi:hypothetical protein